MAELIRIHLGCGSNLLGGWVNVDLTLPEGAVYPKADWTFKPADLTQPFPWPDAYADYVFSEHFIEHLDFEEGVTFLKRVRALLKPGGKVRLSTPNLYTVISDYRLGKLDRWKDVGWMPETPAHLVNEGLHNWGHKFVHDIQSLSLALSRAGFSDFQILNPQISRDPNLRGLECRPDCFDLVVEVTK